MIKNKTKNTLVAANFSWKSGFNKALGLIGKKNPEAIVFNTHFGIHTFFLKLPIDILILSKNNKAVVIKKDLKPNKIFLWKFMYNIVIELPSGSLEKSKTQIGDIIEYDL